MLAFDRSTLTSPRGSSSPRAADGSGERPLERLNEALLARHALGEAREFTVKG